MANEACLADQKRTISPPPFWDEVPSKEEFQRWRKLLGVCPEASFTYFAWGRSYHLIKIGRSFDPSRRRGELEIEHRQNIEIVAEVRGDFEKSYHKLFAEHCHRGEWFKPHPDILDEIWRINGGSWMPQGDPCARVAA